VSDFDKCFGNTMGKEGGYSNNPDDKGGETYKGISRKNWPKWGGWQIIDNTKKTLLDPPTYNTGSYWSWVAHLNRVLSENVTTQNLVKEFYRVNFFGPLADVIDQAVAKWVFDKYVNCGGVAKRWLQRAAGVTDDGVIGPATIAAVNAQHGPDLIAKCNSQAKAYYDNIIANDPSQSQFRHSWYARLTNYNGTPYVV